MITYNSRICSGSTPTAGTTNIEQCAPEGLRGCDPDSNAIWGWVMGEEICAALGATNGWRSVLSVSLVGDETDHDAGYVDIAEFITTKDGVNVKWLDTVCNAIEQLEKIAETDEDSED